LGVLGAQQEGGGCDFRRWGAAACYSLFKERRGWLRKETNTAERLSTVRRGAYITDLGHFKGKMGGFMAGG